MFLEDEPKILAPSVIAIFIYIGLIFGLMLYVDIYDEIVKKYTSKKDDFLQVSIVDKSIKNAFRQKHKSSSKNRKTKSKRSKRSGLGIQELFSKSKIKPKPIPAFSPPKAIASRLKSDEKDTKEVNAHKIVSSLEFESVSKKASSSGEYDEFRGKVQEILDGYWAKTNDTVDGSRAKVQINIDDNGNFSYTIVTLSYNNEFNNKLKDFLEQMRDVEFPKNTKGVPSMMIIFKDEV